MTTDDFDWYQILHVREDAEPEVIRAAYRALIRKNHPDTSKQSADTSLVAARLNEAAEVLLDATARAAYDARRRARKMQGGSTAEAQARERAEAQARERAEAQARERAEAQARERAEAQARERRRYWAFTMVGVGALIAVVASLLVGSRGNGEAVAGSSLASPTAEIVADSSASTLGGDAAPDYCSAFGALRGYAGDLDRASYSVIAQYGKTDIVLAIANGIRDVKAMDRERRAEAYPLTKNRLQDFDIAVLDDLVVVNDSKGVVAYRGESGAVQWKTALYDDYLFSVQGSKLYLANDYGDSVELSLDGGEEITTDYPDYFDYTFPRPSYMDMNWEGETECPALG